MIADSPPAVNSAAPDWSSTDADIIRKLPPRLAARHALLVAWERAVRAMHAAEVLDPGKAWQASWAVTEALAAIDGHEDDAAAELRYMVASMRKHNPDGLDVEFAQVGVIRLLMEHVAELRAEIDAVREELAAIRPRKKQKMKSNIEDQLAVTAGGGE